MAAVDQILQLIQLPKDAVTINCKTMQVQEGDDACGTFAIAVATSLWHGENPSLEAKFDVEAYHGML